MKKITSLILSIITILALLVTLAGCGEKEPASGSGQKEPASNSEQKEPGDDEQKEPELSSEQKKFIGTWEGSIDMTEYLNLLISAEDEGIGTYIKISEAVLVVKMTFREDGTCERFVDKEAAGNLINAIQEDFRSGLTGYFEDFIKEAELDMTVAELLAENGMTMDDLLDAAFGDEMIDSMVSELISEGKYDAKDGKLFVSDGLDADIDETEYETYKISDTELTLLEAFGEDSDELAELDADLYPIIFKKVS